MPEEPPVANIPNNPQPQPVPQSNISPDQMHRPWLKEEKKRPHKSLIVAGIITTVLVVLGCSGWAVYALWYQNPDKVIMDAMINAATAKNITADGSFSSETDGNKYVYTISGVTSHDAGMRGTANLVAKMNDDTEFKLNFEGATSPDGTNYLKVGNLTATYKTLLELWTDMLKDYPEESKQMVLQLFTNMLDPVVKRVDDKWIKFNNADLKKLSADDVDTYNCMDKLYKKIESDKSKTNEVSDRYMQNKFIIIKNRLGMKADSMGYSAAVDMDKMQSFIDSLKTTALYKGVKSCSPKDNPLDIKLSSKLSLRFDIWVSQWSHQLTSFHAISTDMTDGQETTTLVDMTTKFNKEVKVTMPTDAMTFDAAFPEINKFFGGGSDDSTGSNIFGTI